MVSRDPGGSSPDGGGTAAPGPLPGIPGSTGDSEGSQSPSRWRTYRQAVHGALVAVMLLLVLALGAIGLALRPNGTPPAVPNEANELSLTLTPAPTSAQLNETLDATGGGAGELTVSMTSTAANASSVKWSLVVQNFHGHLCPGGNSGVTSHTVPPAASDSAGGSELSLSGHTEVGSEFSQILSIDLCWPQNSPADLSGGYLAAQVPVIDFQTPLGPDLNNVGIGTLRWYQSLTASGLAEYQIQAGQSPTNVTSGGWSWSGSTVNDIELPQRIVSAASLSELARENNDALYAGIFFGVAAAALMVIIQELLVALHRIPQPPG